MVIPCCEAGGYIHDANSNQLFIAVVLQNSYKLLSNVGGVCRVIHVSTSFLSRLPAFWTLLASCHSFASVYYFFTVAFVSIFHLFSSFFLTFFGHSLTSWCDLPLVQTCFSLTIELLFALSDFAWSVLVMSQIEHWLRNDRPG
jgi:hypothetical protein